MNHHTACYEPKGSFVLVLSKALVPSGKAMCVSND